MRRALRLVAVVVIAQTAGCIRPPLPATPGHGGPAWTEVATEHFVIDTGFNRTETVKIALQLENVRNVFVRVVFGRPPKPTAALRVIALRRDEYSQYDRKRGALHQHSGLWTDSDHGARATNGELTNAKFACMNSHTRFPVLRDLGWQPRWLAEGLAMMLSTVYYNAGTGEVEIGHFRQTSKPSTMPWSRNQTPFIGPTSGHGLTTKPTTRKSSAGGTQSPGRSCTASPMNDRARS